MYFLTNTNQSFQIATTDAIELPYTALDVTCIYVVNSQHVNVQNEPKSQTGYLDDTFRDILPSPQLEATQHSIKSIHIVNTDSITHSLVFRMVDSGNPRNIFKCQIKPNWTVSYMNESGWSVYDQFGIKKKDNVDFYLEISKGNVANHLDYGCFGINTDIDTGTTPEDIWDGGGIFIPPTTYRIHAIVSSSVNDASAGTGARTVRIFGVVSTGLAEETITLNGTTPVNTINAYSDIYRMVIYTSGSSLTNAGIITATAAVDSTVTTTIQVDRYNASKKAIRLIPPGYKGYITDWNGSMIQTTASNGATIFLLTKTSTGVWISRGLHSLTNNGSSFEVDYYKIPLLLSAGEWVKAQCQSVTANNTLIQAQINIVLIKD